MSDDRGAKASGQATCGAHRCSGLPIVGTTLCLTHAHEDVRQSFLNELRPGAPLDLRGTPINSELLDRILTSVRDEGGTPTLGKATFDKAQFTKASFRKTRFADEVSFTGASFDGVTGFREARFHEDANFERAQFRYSVTFLNARFSKEAHFSQAVFKHAYYSATRFQGRTWFDATEFESARFDGTQFGEDGRFDDSRFPGTVEFSNVRVIGDLSFDGAHFVDATPFGPLLVRGRLILERALFERDILLEIGASEISCVAARFNESAVLRVRFAEIVLDRAAFAKPSTLTFAEAKFVSRERLYGPRIIKSRAQQLLEEEVLSCSGREIRPRLLSIRGVDASSLVLADLDLSRCLFAGAHNLDKLRIEGPRLFADAPRGWKLGRVGGQGLPLWRWTRRQTLAEEHHWRASLGLAQAPSGRPHPKRAGWQSSEQEVRPWIVERTGQRIARLPPDRLASLYRALRKAQEDNKNEPGAADFYYGEMEMRRKAASTPRAEKLIIDAYWAISGYGLRALRAIACLVTVVAIVAILLQRAGFNGGDPALRDALIHAVQSTLSLESKNRALTERMSWFGEVLRIVVRLAGPVLLALALLAVRNRVKR
jgi:uncharacterized protein YjbI with pentapeptide repeats